MFLPEFPLLGKGRVHSCSCSGLSSLILPSLQGWHPPGLGGRSRRWGGRASSALPLAHMTAEPSPRPPSHRGKSCLPLNHSLVPKRLGTAAPPHTRSCQLCFQIYLESNQALSSAAFWTPVTASHLLSGSTSAWEPARPMHSSCNSQRHAISRLSQVALLLCSKLSNIRGFSEEKPEPS